MAFEKLADLVETHKVTLSRTVAKSVLARQFVSYQHDSIDTLAPLMVRTLEAISGYLRSSEPTEYRNFVQQLTLMRLRNGYNAEDFYNIVEFFTHAIKDLVAKELTGPDHLQTDLERYYRRIEGMQTLTYSIIVATRSAFTKNS
jgi:hypothetical protein